MIVVYMVLIIYGGAYNRGNVSLLPLEFTSKENCENFTKQFSGEDEWLNETINVMKCVEVSGTVGVK
jgi:hypothetical protein